jgi:flagellar basal-body rod protein FlgG
MAIIALQSAASALSALNTALDVTANNLANVNTTGFKSSRANFQDLLYIERAQPGVENANGDQRPIGLYVGLGVKVSGTQLNFSPGNPIVGNEFDLMIDGPGFFKVRVEDSLGGTAYTRAGHFVRNSEGNIVLASSDGRRLDPNIPIPPDATGVQVTSDGRVWFTTAGTTAPQEAGQIQLVNFVNPAGLKQVGETLFTETAASGNPVEGIPGTDNRGTIKQGYTESSNVDPTRELIDMIRTQRAFEMNSNSIRAADDTLRAVAQLRR